MEAVEDPRAHLQRRVALFAGVAGTLFAIMLVVDFFFSAEGEATFSTSRLANLATVLVCFGVMARTRGGERSPAESRVLEVVLISVMAVVFGGLPVFPPVPGAGPILSFFTLIPLFVGVLLRAAVIPSPAWLSVAVALGWGGIITVSGYVAWQHHPVIGLLPPAQTNVAQWQIPLSFGITATGAAALVAAAISRIVHGLETQVREARELGPYVLEWKIGEGGMGAVYRARHRFLRRPTAIKLLPSDKAGEEAVARFEREVREAARLTHPNTVQIFDFGRTADGVFYYAMEHLEGLTLQALVEDFGAIHPPARAIHILAAVAEALDEAHAMGLVHRDIKPDNIMLCERGGVADVPKVLDYGLVKDMEDDSRQLSAADVVIGTPLYLAPESATNPDGVDARTDVYALGAVGFYLLAGEPVFEGRTAAEVIGHHLHTPAPALATLRDDLGPDLPNVIARCLEKDPEDRYPTAGDLADALRLCADVGTWRRADARAWWKKHRDAIIVARNATPQPTELRIARHTE